VQKYKPSPARDYAIESHSLKKRSRYVDGGAGVSFSVKDLQKPAKQTVPSMELLKRPKRSFNQKKRRKKRGEGYAL